MPASIQHIKSGKLRALAVTTAARSDALPEVPALSEFLPSYEASGWSGFCGPKNVGSPIIKTLNITINECLSDPRVRARFADLGAMTLVGSAGDFGQLIIKETDKWARVIRIANIKAD
jgi:tripartite-type tricarboxylate transporter receptor subunit TctC